VSRVKEKPVIPAFLEKLVILGATKILSDGLDGPVRSSDGILSKRFCGSQNRSMSYLAVRFVLS